MRELQHGSGIADSLHSLGNVTCEQDDYSTARQMFEEGLAIRRERGDRRGWSLAGWTASVVAACCDSSCRLTMGGGAGARRHLTAIVENERPLYEKRVSAARQRWAMTRPSTGLGRKAAR